MKTTDKQILEGIRQSPAFKDYEAAFQRGLGLPLTLTAAETIGLPHHGRRNEGAFCRLIGGDRRACAACLAFQAQLCDKAVNGAATITCFAGFVESAVPISLGGRTFGLLQTGQVRLTSPTELEFRNIEQFLSERGSTVDLVELRKTFFSAPVIEPDRYESMVALLRHFAEHIEATVNQIVVRMQNAEAPVIQRAKDFIERHHTEELSLEQAARAVNTSTFYFCKIFKKATGITFTDYLTRVRIEKAKKQLLNPHLRVSEIAFAVGFQSLSQFNRAFRGIVGQSPTQYRAKLPRMLVA